MPEPGCPPSVKNCTADEADTFSLNLPAGRHGLTVKVRPAGNHEPVVEGLAIRRTDKGFQWTSPQGPRTALVRRPVAIRTADDTLLTEADGSPTLECQTLGLVPITGVGSRTPYALWSILAESRLPGDIGEVRLTIDAAYQAAALESLRKRLVEFFPENVDPYAKERRAAVVILNAETGAILAAAGHPAPPLGVHPWDIAAFAKVYPVRNPMVVRGWQGADANNAPGSTFKPVVALAAMSAARRTPGLHGFLKGYPQSSFERRTGLTLGCRAYDPEAGRCVSPGSEKYPAKIRNFGDSGRVPLGRAFTKNPPGERRLGLKQALRDSINVWFVRLAMLTDGEKARAYDRAFSRFGASAALPDFQLVETAKTLGFDDGRLDLAPNPPDGVRLRRRRGVWDALTAYTGRVDLMLEEMAVTRVRVLAQNAIGQSAMATPLQMARTAASVRFGKRVHPFLIDRWGADVSDAPEPAALPFPDRTLLLDGMKAVVGPRGTARLAFRSFPPEQRDRLHGKTGTANVPGRGGGRGRSQKTYFTTWFMAAFEPSSGPPLALACMITHAHGDHRTGGTSSALVVADILERLFGKGKEAP